MDEITCSACRSVNPADASFCSRCGAALAAPAAAASGPSGWALATAGMDQPAVATGPYGPLRKKELAGWWGRLGAWILDGIIVTVVGGVLAGIVALVWWLVEPDSLQELWDDFMYGDVSAYGYPNDGMGAFLTFALVGVAFALAWETLWWSSKAMATPGQLAVGFRLAKVEGLEPLSRGRAFARALAKLLYNIPNLGGLVLIVSAFTIGLSGRKQGIHDMIAGTACVKKDALRMRGVGPDVVEGGVLPPPPALSSYGNDPSAPWGQPTVAGPPPPAPGTPPPSPPSTPPGGNGPFV